MDRTSSIGELKGIGAKTEQLFHNLGVYTIGDILLHYPRDYDKLPPITPLPDLPKLADRARGQEGFTAAIAARVEKAPAVRAGRNLKVTSLDRKSVV